MAKFTKSEDISVHQSLRYTDGVPGTPPKKVMSGSEEIYQQFGTGSNLLQVSDHIKVLIYFTKIQI